MTLHAWIGYDGREAEAYAVAEHSLKRHSDDAIAVHRLAERPLRAGGIFSRPFADDPNGFRIDGIDGRPYTTEFAFTRFLVPYLMNFKGWALFVDCDFLFRADIADVFALADDKYAALCVKHQHVPTEPRKMDNVPQTTYRRKNWSSFVLWNCAHPKNVENLTPANVNGQPGAWLHGFDWLDDDEIGFIDEGWNWLDGVSPTTECPSFGDRYIKAIHYTLGGPWFGKASEHADAWIKERAKMQSESVHGHRVSVLRDTMAA